MLTRAVGVVGILLLVLAGPPAVAQTGRPLKFGILVLPLQVGKGTAPEEAYLGLAVQDVLMAVRSRHTGLDECPDSDTWGQLFPKPEDFETWLKDGQPEPAAVETIGMRYLLTGQVEAGADRIVAKLVLRDRQQGKESTTEIAVDLPGLVEFRKGFLRFLEGAGIPPAGAQESKMLWEEEIPREAFALSGRVTYDYACGALYKGDQPLDLTAAMHAAELAPRSYTVLTTLGNMLLRDKMYDKAAPFFRRAVERNPTGEEAMSGLADAAASRGDEAEEEQWYLRAGEVRGKSRDAALAMMWSSRGWTAYRNKDYGKALECLQRVRELDPKNVNYVKDLTNFYYDRDKAEEAEAVMRSALKELTAASDRALVGCWLGNGLNWRGNRAYEAKDYEQAIGCHKEAMSLNPGTVVFVTNLAGAYRESQRWQEGQEVLEAELRRFTDADARAKLQTGLAQLWVAQANAAFQAGQRDEAAALYRRAAPYDAAEVMRTKLESAELETARRDVVERVLVSALEEAKEPELQKAIRYGLGLVWNSRGNTAYEGADYTKAVECYQRAMEYDPDYVFYVGQIVRAYKEAGQFREGRQLVEEALQKVTEDADRETLSESLAELAADEGHAAFSKGDRERALALYREAVGHDPDAVIYSDLEDSKPEFERLGIAQQAVEAALGEARGDEARQALELALARLLNRRGILLARAGDSAAGIEWCQKAIAHDPTTTLYITNLAAMYSETQRFDEAEKLLKDSLAKLPGAEPQQQLKTKLAGVYNERGFKRDAARQYDKAIEDFRAARDLDPAEPAYVGNLARAYVKAGRAQDAALLWETALKQASAETDPRKAKAAAAGIWMQRGHGAYDGGDYDRARQHYDTAAKLRRETNDRSGETEALRWVGYALLPLKRHDEAMRAFEAAVGAAQEAKDRPAEAQALYDLGFTYNAVSDWKRATQYVDQALAIRRDLKDRAQEATAVAMLGTIAFNSGDYNTALGHYDEALKTHTELGNRGEEASVRYGFGRAHHELGEYQKALEEYGRALSYYREAEDKDQTATVLYCSGLTYEALTEAEKAIPLYEEAAGLWRDMGDREWEANSLNRIGTARYNLGQAKEALGVWTQVLAMQREAKDRAGEAVALNNLGAAHSDLKEYEKAVECFGQALVIQREVGDPREEANTLDNMAQAYGKLGQPSKAIEHYKQCLEAARKAGDREREDTTLVGLASAHEQLGAYTEAEAALKALLELRKQIHGSQDGSVVEALQSLARVYQLMGDYDRALPLMVEALKIRRQLGAPASDLTASARQLEALLNRLVQINKSIYGPNDAAVAATLEDLGGLYSSLNQHDRAIASCTEAVALQKQIHTGDHAAVAACLCSLGAIYRSAGNAEKALGSYREGLAMLERIHGPTHLEVAGVLVQMGQTQELAGDWAEAESAYRRALDIQKEALGLANADVLVSLTRLARVCQQQGKGDEATALQAQAEAARRTLVARKHNPYLAGGAKRMRARSVPPGTGGTEGGAGQERSQEPDLESAQEASAPETTRGRSQAGGAGGDREEADLAREGPARKAEEVAQGPAEESAPGDQSVTTTTHVAPWAGVMTPKADQEVAEDTITVQIMAADDRAPERVEVTIDGQLVSGAKERSVRSTDLAGAIPAEQAALRKVPKIFTLTVPLPQGRRDLRLGAVVFDNEGLKSEPVEVMIHRATVVPVVGTLRVVCIGVSKYKDSALNLDYADDDAQALAELFKKQAAFGPTDVECITNEEATLSRVLEALGKLQMESRSDDVVVIFLAGHGMKLNETEFYFATHEVDRGNIRETALSWQHFQKILKTTDRRQLVLLLDACHSGDALRAALGNLQADTSRLAATAKEGAGAVVFASCKGNQASVEADEWGHGAFTKALLEALGGGADLDRDNQIGVWDVMPNVYKRVRDLTGKEQEPYMSDATNIDFGVALVRLAPAT